MLALWIVLYVFGYLLTGATFLVGSAKVLQKVAPSADLTDMFEACVEDAEFFIPCVIFWPLVIAILLIVGPLMGIYFLANLALEWEPKPKKKKESPKAVGSRLEGSVDKNLIMDLERENEMRGSRCYCEDAHLNHFCPKPRTDEQIAWTKELQGYLKYL